MKINSRFKSVTFSCKTGFPRHGWKASLLASVMVLAFGLSSLDANALALGRINVLSVLGEPLRAEIDIPDISQEEASSLRAFVASPEAFRASGLDYNVIVSSVEVKLQKRPDGRSFLRLTSTRPVNDPFLDLVLETQWATGRIVRDYTMLFDPPGLRQQAVPTAPQVAPTPPAAVSRPAPATPPIAGAPSPAVAPARPAPSPKSPVAPPVAATPSGNSQVTVRAGDTAGRIAAANKPDSVSLDQMLVALQRNNPDAFIGGNVNRVKAGAVLDIPTAEQAAATPANEASKTVNAQSKDFNQYRRRLAEEATTARNTSLGRQAVGKVEATVEDQKPAASAPDKLTLSKGGVQAKATEAQIAASAQAKEATERTAELARNISDLAKLQAASGITDSTPALAASAAKQGSVNVTTGSPPAVAPAVVASDLKPAVETPAPVAEASAAAPAEVAASASVTPEPVAPTPTPIAKAPTPTPPEPSLLSEIMDNPMAPIAAGGLVALLAGFGLYRARQRKKSGPVDSSFLESRLQPDSFFGVSGGQRIDTKEATTTGSSMVYSPSQLDAVGDVDPVAEADVYLAYGRDLQAEEILKEAMRTNPTRVAIHSKLLEIYAKRRDTKAFEVVATEAYGLTTGNGLEWEQICERGRDLDPGNPLYQPGGAPPARSGVAAVSVTPSGFHASTVSATSPVPLEASAVPVAVDLDLDLDFSSADTSAGDQSRTPGAILNAAPVMTPPASPPAIPAQPTSPTPLDIDMEGLAHNAVQPSGFGAIDISMPDLPHSGLPEAESTHGPSDSGMMEFDLGSLSLDLDPTTTVTPKADAAGASTSDDPLVTKLALAKEFLSIGDDDGARALVKEVMVEASGDLKSKAEKLLAEIG